MKEYGLNWIVFSVILAVLYAITINLLEFVDIPESHLNGFLSLGVQWMIVSLVSTGILGLISFNRIVFVILFPILILLSVVEVFYRFTLGATITGTTIEIALENNAQMWMSVINFRLIIIVFISLLITVFIATFRWKYVKVKGRLSLIWLGFCVCLSSSPIAISRIYGAVSNRMPYALYAGTRDYLRNKKVVNEKRNTYDNVPVKASETPPDLIVVIGESLRSDHLPMNNYPRMTMPLLSKEENFLVFKDIKSSGFHTYQSMPYLMTRADSLNVDIGYEEQSFISLFKKAGYRSSWIANQDISGSYSYFAHEADTLIHVNSQRSLYSYDKWLDTDVIPFYEIWKSQNNNCPTISVIHSIGSHWWTKSHYSDQDAVFLPDMDSKELSVLDPQQIINSYDNSVIATDRFLHSLIEKIRSDNVILIFVADHAESLGEGGRWLHGSNGPELHDIAALVWFSSQYEKNFPEKIDALRKNVNKSTSSDNLFYSVIDAAGLETSVSDLSKSWFYEE